MPRTNSVAEAFSAERRPAPSEEARPAHARGVDVAPTPPHPPVRNPPSASRSGGHGAGRARAAAKLRATAQPQGVGLRALLGPTLTRWGVRDPREGRGRHTETISVTEEPGKGCYPLPVGPSAMSV